MTKTAILFLAANSAALVSAIGFAHGWGAREIEISDTATLQKHGAQQLVVRLEPIRVNESDTTSVYLEGKRDGKTIWKRPFPMKGEIDIAKAGVLVHGHSIQIWTVDPAEATMYRQDFDWDGQSLTFASDHMERQPYLTYTPKSE